MRTLHLRPRGKHDYILDIGICLLLAAFIYLTFGLWFTVYFIPMSSIRKEHHA